jgi:hypothetical protein
MPARLALLSLLLVLGLVCSCATPPLSDDDDRTDDDDGTDDDDDDDDSADDDDDSSGSNSLAEFIGAVDILAASLTDLGWEETSRAVDGNGVTFIDGTFPAGEFGTLNSDGIPTYIEGGWHEVAALALPPTFPDVSWAANTGLVWAAHTRNAVLNPDKRAEISSIALGTGLPILMHGQALSDWDPSLFGTDYGRDDLVANTLPAAHSTNPCDPVDIGFGQAHFKLAEVALRANTVLQRLVEAEGGAIEDIGLHGFSKEGGACWHVSMIDPRMRVAACGGFRLYDSPELIQYEEDWACQGPLASHGFGQGDTTTQVQTVEWAAETAAGALWRELSRVSPLATDHYTEFIFNTGDGALGGTHDGEKYPMALENRFLSELEVPGRYFRALTQDDGRPNSNRWLINLAGWLADPAGFEAGYPQVLETSLEDDGAGSFRIRADIAGSPDLVRLAWNQSEDRIYWDRDLENPGPNDQTEWTPVEMSVDSQAGDGSWISPWVTPDAGMEDVPYYVSARKQRAYPSAPHQVDVSLTRFYRRAPEASCAEVPTVCE